MDAQEHSQAAVLLKLELEGELNQIGGRRPMTNGSCGCGMMGRALT